VIYFVDSQQLLTQCCLTCNEPNVSGILIKKLPAQSTDDDTWNRVLHLAATSTDKELQKIPLIDLLRRLFHEETILLFDPSEVDFCCSCSRERTSAMLLALGKAEVIDIIEKEGEVAVTCEFCNAKYSFDRIDIEQVFLTGESEIPSTTEH